ncbi:MAG TPA: hypothetical protein VMB50_17650 [Myxococcales bacterium]|nr:hypothetical protein [Myxococcales bacterium]
MRRGPAIAVATLGVASCIVGTLDLTGFRCDGDHPCLSGYLCLPAADGGSCQIAGGSSGGTTGGGVGGSSGGGSGSSGGVPCTGVPTCSGDGTSLVLCDGGLLPCASGTACDYGTCRPACRAGACDAGICDQAANACVPTAACAGAGGACGLAGGSTGICLAGLCTPVPPLGGSPGSCDAGGLADAGPLLVGGVIALFPGAVADPGLLDGGSVTFFSAHGARVGPLAIVPSPGSPHEPSYANASLTPGTWTALVQAPAVALPTYFPNLVVAPPPFGASVNLDLTAVAPIDAAGSVAGVTPRPGHLVWIARAATCDASSFLGGYTVGLSPAPAFAAYYDAPSGQLEADPTLTASSPQTGEFIALDAPYAPTSYALAVEPAGAPVAIAAGTFTPPPYVAGQTIAVALIFPNQTP